MAATMRPRCGPVLQSSRSRQSARVCASLQQPQRNWSIATAVCRVWQTHVSRPQAAAVQQAVPQEQQSVAQQLKQQCSGMAAVLPFASTTIVKASSSTQAEIYFGLAKAVDIYLAILTVRVLLSWFRNIDWFSEPWNTLRQLTDPFLSVFRGIIPPLGGIDLSPMLGFFLLNLLRGFLMNFAM
eukprot:GHRQ01002383.1.p1 GENE.GHRQ01002383.1~~GHRQ01002383.1.p1  ORF type:complete len:183 (+),score=80.85 GHRQ01002383.1:131-679(+)